ncbi:hypothetical protein AM500_11320 [Bacillus sp. FJAT-18017]|uniref:DUF429 domain-containing protein n=1 Tax=Bacillus sp. FJAT-18017 TaxID=1705566 RepID=UPI0006AE4D9C|nr:DUF429 domain-containing protein [Bacillus sp. FJAT-18017]ALC90309.1 hypothetical protein AM500_11320 [Bacillus sp. FJAT-18017]
MKYSRVIGIGWDVGGWLGNNHGVAACVWEEGMGSVEWIGSPSSIALPEDRLLRIPELVKAISKEYALIEDDETMIVIGVDAPLSFPSAFAQLLGGADVDIRKPAREIDNIFAYRDTDRHIHAVFGKKPLSATFDRIGNNATVAMAHIKMWEKEGDFVTYPFHPSNAENNKVILEVYPALVKERKSTEAFPGIKQLLPTGLVPGTDAYDAAICALYAIAFGSSGTPLPALVGPNGTCDGWIYHFSKEDLEKMKCI